jgi:hypothetical protein
MAQAAKISRLLKSEFVEAHIGNEQFVAVCDTSSEEDAGEECLKEEDRSESSLSENAKQSSASYEIECRDEDPMTEGDSVLQGPGSRQNLQVSASYRQLMAAKDQQLTMKDLSAPPDKSNFDQTIKELEDTSSFNSVSSAS